MLGWGQHPAPPGDPTWAGKEGRLWLLATVLCTLANACFEACHFYICLGLSTLSGIFSFCFSFFFLYFPFPFPFSPG